MALIGRGAMGNPWLFQRGNAALEGGEIPPLPPLSRRVDVALRQFELACRMKGERIACLEARKHFAWYLRGVPYSGRFKAEISAIYTMRDIYRISRKIKEELR
jgi:tRNA-dihydrouridine synthase B